MEMSMIADKKRLVIVAVGIFFLIVLWAILTVPEAPKVDDSEPTNKIMTYENNTISEEKDGKPVWELTAKYMEVNVETRDTRMQGITGKLYDNTGETLALNAEEGNFFDATKNIILSGSVVATYTDGTKLTSDRLEWLADTSNLRATGSVTLAKGDMTATGDELESFEEFTRFRLKGKAHIELNK